MNKKENPGVSRRGAAMLLLFSLAVSVLLGFAMPVHAADGGRTTLRTLRVGFYPYTGYMATAADGSRSGYADIFGLAPPGRVALPDGFSYARYEGYELKENRGNYAYPTMLDEHERILRAIPFERYLHSHRPVMSRDETFAFLAAGRARGYYTYD